MTKHLDNIMKFEWNKDKNKLNFADPLHISKLDYRFSYFEERWITIGATNNYSILVVANLFFTDDGEEIIRLISARKANKNERKSYEKC
jgi:uncharacterized DUF497 family protein